MASKAEQAYALLKSTSWFGEASDELLKALSEKFILVEAQDGHIFVTEGGKVDHFMVLEEGVLARTKLHVQQKATRESVRESLRNLKASEVSEAIAKHTVQIDTIEGKGCVTGLLHNVKESSMAYATVTAKGPAKVWLMNGATFREIISSKQEFMWDMIAAMARELRTGSKSIRQLMTNLRTGQTGKGGSGGKDTLRVLVYDTTSWVSDAFQPAIQAFNKAQGDGGFQMVVDYTSERLGPNSATYAAGYDAICTFVNDTADADTMQTLSRLGVRMISQRYVSF
jgi:CRP-like cAMP-binding protein